MNAPMTTRASSSRRVATTVANPQPSYKAVPSLKRPAGKSPEKVPRKRAVLGDITNPCRTALPSKKQNRRSLGKAPDCDTIKSSQESCKTDDSLYTTASENSVLDVTGADQSNVTVAAVPAGVSDYDSDCRNDPFAESNYAADIFNYYREREVAFLVPLYLDMQPELSATMRAILVDWMVEVQESFELNHETLYLAVKLVDTYLSKVVVGKATLQLLGATALFVASKFDERCPPSVEDFLYICDDAYSRKEIISLEVKLLKTMDFQLGMPLSYRFLRRYARCNGLPLELLTLARYVLELSLLDYTLIDRRESLLAAAALLQALRMKNLQWNCTLEYYSGYKESELLDLQHHLNKLIAEKQSPSLETIRSKYSHKVFYEVALVPHLPL
ncbi:G2/mitotic-specific cyclin-B3-like isoform X2 [Ornithodoros turicata]|uniref:G2/mitotic-specific cyclin-B3-like isoform X2 n=1 Tax=Ornithodoros turicata TaxID=34597 RepID=UPI003138E817